MRESTYQGHLIRRIREMFAGQDFLILKNDANYIQGIPDLTILFEDGWATLEVKTSKDAPTQPNQPYYVELMNRMSFSAFIYPENEDEVLDGLQRTFFSRRQARLAQSKQLSLG